MEAWTPGVNWHRPQHPKGNGFSNKQATSQQHALRNESDLVSCDNNGGETKPGKLRSCPEAAHCHRGCFYSGLAGRPQRL